MVLFFCKKWGDTINILWMDSQRWLSWYMELLDHWHTFYVHALNLERYSILVIILKTNWLYSFLPFHYLFFSEWKRQEVFVLKWAINSCKCWFCTRLWEWNKMTKYGSEAHFPLLSFQFFSKTIQFSFDSDTPALVPTCMVSDEIFVTH